MNFCVIVTLGPSTLSAEKMKAIDRLGPCIYRINGSHCTGKDDVIALVEHVKNVLPQAQLLVDLPGNKIRLKQLSEPIRFYKGETIMLAPHQLNYSHFYRHLRAGNLVKAHDAIYTFEVISIKDQIIELKAYCEGALTGGRGLHVPGIHGSLPFLLDLDEQIIEAVTEAGVHFLGLSFVRDAEDVRTAKRKLLANGNSFTAVISKVETKEAVANLEDILNEVDMILVDRGDLSCDVGMMNMPKYQEQVLKTSQLLGKKVFLATQFLKNMELFPLPSIAEEIDLYNTLKAKVDGVQLSEETAIGKYPVECVAHVFEVYQKILESQEANRAV